VNDFAQIMVRGTLIDAPNLKQMNNGDPVCNFKISCVPAGKNVVPLELSVSVFGNNANEAGRMYQGSTVIVVGKLRKTSWQGKQGPPREDLSIAASDFEVTTAQPAGQGYPPQQQNYQQPPQQQGGPGYGASSPQQQAPQQAPQQGGQPQYHMNADDIPF